MVTQGSLERLAGRVNLRIHRGCSLSNDDVLMIEMRRQGIDDAELGEADMWCDRAGRIYWSWAPLVGIKLIQLPSGRLKIINART